MASAMVTIAGVSSVAWNIGSMMLYKAAEVSLNTAIGLLKGQADSVGEVQYILMELDIEAKFKTVRSLLYSVEEGLVEVPAKNKDFVSICVGNVKEAMSTISATLERVQNKMDKHAQQWFSRYRSFDVVEDLHLLKAQCRMFDKRLEVLVQCLSVPLRQQDGAGTQESSSGHDLVNQRIFGESYSFMEYESSGMDRMKSILMAERAFKDAEFGHGEEVETKTYSTPSHQTRHVFEDPVFL